MGIPNIASIICSAFIYYGVNINACNHAIQATIYQSGAAKVYKESISKINYEMEKRFDRNVMIGVGTVSKFIYNNKRINFSIKKLNLMYDNNDNKNKNIIIIVKFSI